MKLEAIQGEVVRRLKAATGLTGIAIMQDDGLYPKLPELEAALAANGVVMIVFEPQPVSVIATGGGTVANLRVSVLIRVLENVIVNTGATGTKIPSVKIVRLILEAVLGDVSPSYRQTFVPAEQPFEHRGTEEGVRFLGARVAINVPIHEDAP